MSAVVFHQGPVGAALVDGALLAGATAVTLKVTTGTLTGTVIAGATFTVAGETGLPTHTVTGEPQTCALNAVSLTFTPAIATGGVADGAALTFGAAIICNGIFDASAATLSDEFHSEAVYRMPMLTVATAQIAGVVDTDGVLVDGTAYTVREIISHTDGAISNLLLAKPQ